MAADGIDWKKLQFITIAQTAWINNAINKSLNEDAIRNRAEFSATATLGFMRDVFWAAERIPVDLDPADAADQFVHYFLEHEGAKAQDWFLRST
jgi:hypothetical protein